MRRRDWQARLIAYVAARANQPFAWGSQDCALFAAGAVEAMTGADLAKGWRGYRTAQGAALKLTRAGFASVHDAARAALPRRAGRPKPGDVALIDGDDGPALGIVQGVAIYVPGPLGLALVPLSAATEFLAVD